MKYKCRICGFIYDEDKEPVKFKDLPEDWVCPICGASKMMFAEVEEK
jgi:rubredoxin